MEKWTVVGFRLVDFTDTKSDKRISGYTLFLSRPGKDGIEGDEVDRIYINDRKVDYVPALGDDIQLIYNRFGKIGDVVLC